MEFVKKNPIIILIAGKARSGKSTLSQYIKENLEKDNKKVIISPYTKYLKHYIEEITGIKITEENKPRDMLQKISSDLIKKELGKENFFINRQIEDIEIYSYFTDAIIIPDVRFPNEIEIIKNKFKNVYSIGIIRENYQSDLTEEQQKDITETSLDNYQQYDYLILNKKETNLYEEAKKIKSILERRNSNE